MSGSGPPSREDVATATTGRGVLSGGLWNGVTTVVPALYTMIQSVAVARTLGPDGAGRQSYIAWSYLMLGALLSAGMPNALLRYVGITVGAGRSAALRGLLSWAWRVEAVAAALGAAILVGIGTQAEPRPAWVLAGVACAASVMQSIPAAVLAGLQRWREASLIALATGTVSTAAVLVVLDLGGGIEGIFFVEAATATINLVVAGLVARRALARQAPDVEEDTSALRREVLRYAAVASIQILFHLVVWRRSELLLLNRYAPDSEIAMYSIPYAAVWAVDRLPTGILAALTPAFATLIGGGHLDRVRSGTWRALRFSLLLSLPLTAGLVAVGPTALRVIFGDEYRRAGTVVAILALAFPMVTASKVTGSLLQGLGRLRYMVTTGLVATAVNLTCAFALIPRHGAVGAAFANLAAQSTASMMSVAFAWRRFGPAQLGGSSMARYAASAMVTGLVAWLTCTTVDGAAGLTAAVVVGVLVHALMVAATRAVPAVDAAWIVDAVSDRVGGRPASICRRLLRSDQS